MQKIHVRNIFRLIVPLHSEEVPIVDFVNTESNFGFTLSYPSTATNCSYKIRLFSDIKEWHQPNKSKTETDSTGQLQWGMKTQLSFLTNGPKDSIEALLLHLRIGPGFDFRKIPKRFVRFEVACFILGHCQRTGYSKPCQLLGKRRHANHSAVGLVSIPIIWSDEQQDFALQEFEALIGAYDENCRSEEKSPSAPMGSSESDLLPISEQEHVLQLVDSRDLSSTNTSPNDSYIHEGTHSNNDSAYYTYDDAYYQHDNEQYMVLYNGSAEVIGNFRALNFYKASDINIKEEIERLNKNRDCRAALLSIDGVEYKLKDGVKGNYDTNKRFVGYIAQQIQSVVPEAVQLIDGILHVDYESLIPYLSESIKQNFKDVNDIKSETERLQATVEILYEDFIKREAKEREPKKPTPISTVIEVLKTKRATPWWQFLILIVVVLVAVAGAIVGTYFGVTNNAQPQPSTSPTPTSTQPQPTYLPAAPTPQGIFDETTDRLALIDLFVSTNGGDWVGKTKWLTNSPICEWYGVKCADGYRVSTLLFGNLNLRGQIPESIGNLDRLEEFVAYNNSFVGTLPASLGKLRSLRRFWVSHSKNLVGTIPQMTSEMLTEFKIINCSVSGTIHEWLSNPRIVRKLEDLNLSDNQLNGTIPNSISNMTQLFALSLANNQFVGTIPTLPSSIRNVNVSSNSFEGPLPNGLTGVPMVRSVFADFSNNKLTGNTQPLMSIVHLVSLNLKNNSLDGTFDLLESQIEYWNTLDLSLNNFESVRATFTEPPRIVKCNASSNPFKCPIPPWVLAKCNATCT